MKLFKRETQADIVAEALQAGQMKAQVKRNREQSEAERRLSASYNAVSGVQEGFKRLKEMNGGFTYEVKEKGEEIFIETNLENNWEEPLRVHARPNGRVALYYHGRRYSELWLDYKNHRSYVVRAGKGTGVTAKILKAVSYAVGNTMPTP